MSTELPKAELDELVAAPRAERYEYFIRNAVENGEVWTLAADDSLLVLGNESKEQFVVLFSHPDFALQWFESSGLDEADLVGMDLGGWVEGNLADLAESGIEIAVFPTAEDEATFVDPLHLLAALTLVQKALKPG